ncbi:biopolymer transporter ExbD [Mucilaginibacter sp. UR6-11]|uniref:ExbD/TolR family protein n=1 Tax=Mucilaginibacter sp. UR6-11 TaxID=1435644 RepID=UPI001E604730|nr:biopolymer transporter ExbD [Mucilaginibacter sp. UR6-11]MCC8424691.1 biopolymer transporter ExbD [Mucilaginibacter sp. UR6-11]
MAELETKPAADNNGGRTKSNKKSTRVDLTAMVDLAFLLITFFILTTTLQKPTAMDLVMPDQGDTRIKVPESRTMTVLLGANNKLEWYIGQPGHPLTQPSVDNFGKNGIRRALLEQSARIKQQQGKDMIVLIKPSDQSNYANMVNMMDELNITNNNMRAIVDITPGEVNLLKRDNIYNQ